MAPCILLLPSSFQLESPPKLEADRKLIRGETIELSFLAEYYWGQPWRGNYSRPDGRSLVVTPTRRATGGQVRHHG